MTMATYIKFDERPHLAERKTRAWAIISIEPPHAYLGEIKWFGRWRKYVFFPGADTLFEEICLREIALFIEVRTREHRFARKAP